MLGLGRGVETQVTITLINFDETTAQDRDFRVLVEGISADMIESSVVKNLDGHNVVLLKVNIIPPPMYMDGPSRGELITIAGSSRPFDFIWRQSCHYPSFCSRFGFIVHPERSANLVGQPWDCDESVCSSPEDLQLPRLLSSKSIEISSRGGDDVVIALSNIVTEQPSVWMGRQQITSYAFDWMSYKNISLSVPALEDAPCSECGRLCQCTASIQIYDSASPESASVRKVSLQVQYISPILGPPVLLSYSFGCILKPCAHSAIISGQSVDVKVTLGNFPAIPRPFVKCLTSGPRCLGDNGYVSKVVASGSMGSIKSISILSSNARETKLILTYTAPLQLPSDGYVALFLSHSTLPKAYLYLPIIRIKPPYVSNIFPEAISRDEAPSRSVSIQILNWVGGETTVSLSTVFCLDSASASTGEVHVAHVDDVRNLAELSFSFTSPDSLTQCEYQINLQLHHGSDSWNMSVSLQVSDTTATLSLAPSSASMLGGSGMQVVLSNFPSVQFAADVQILFIDHHNFSRPAPEHALLWSNEGDGNLLVSTGLFVQCPSSLRPGTEEVRVLHSNGVYAKGLVMFESEPIDTPPLIPIQGGRPVSLHLLSFPTDDATHDVQVFIARDGLIQKQLIVHTVERHEGNVVVQFTAPSASRAGRVDGEIRFVNRDSSEIDPYWRIQYFSLHYFTYPSGSISPSRASTHGGTMTTIRVQDTFFPAYQVEDLPLVLFGQSAARVSRMSGADVIELQVEVPEYQSARLIEVLIVFGSMITDGVEHAAATSVIEFEYFTPMPVVKSVLPSKWKMQGEASVRLVLQHFPEVQSAADISVTLGDASASVTEIVFSGDSETILMIEVPALGIQNKFGTVSWGGITSVFPFKVYDARAIITCQRATDSLGCVGAVSGGEMLIISVNFGPISMSEHLSIIFAAISAPHLQILESNSSVTKLQVQVPSAIGRITTTTSLYLEVINNEISDVQEQMVSASTEFKYVVAPTLLSAVLHHDGSGVQLSFDQDTNNPDRQEDGWRCNQLFEDTTLSVFGIDPTCSWIDRKTLDVQFRMPGTRPCIEGTAVWVKGGIIEDVDGLMSLQSDSKRMALLQFQPSMYLGLQVSGIMTVGPCDDAIVRASASFWGNLMYQWGSPSCDIVDVGPALALCSQLASLTSDTLRLSAGLLQDIGEYKFRVSVSSPVGITSAKFEFSVFKNPVPLPLVSLVGPTMLSSGKDVRISAFLGVASVQGGFDLASCMVDQGQQKPIFEWRQVDQGTRTDGVISESSLRQNSGALILTAAHVALVPGSYKIELRLSSGIYSQTVSSEFSFTVVRSSLVAHIEGARNRVISHQDPMFTLNGLSSHDPDSSASTLSYLWSCSDALGFACRNRNTHDLIVFASTPTVTILGGTLEAGQSFSFALQVSKDSRVSSDMVTVAVVSHYVPPTAIDCPRAKVYNNQFWINADQRIILHATCASCSSVRWSVGGRQIQGDTGASYHLVVLGSDLQSGQSYTYSISSMAPAPVGYTCREDGEQCEGFASILIKVNPPPTGGQCVLSIPGPAPTEMDLFFVRCTGFCDLHQPLEYTFGYLAGSSQFFTSSSELSSVSMYLPAANDVSVFAFVKDSLGSSRRVEIGNVTVHASTMGAIATISTINSLVMLGRVEFHNFAVVLSNKLDRQAQERRRESSYSLRSTRASLEEEDTMIRNQMISSLADVFTSSTQDTENAFQTIASLTALIKDNNVGADAAMLGASTFFSACEILRKELSSLAGGSSYQEHAQGIVTCAARLSSNIKILLPGPATQELIERKLRPGLDVAADLSMLDAVVGEQSMICSSSANDDCMHPLAQSVGAIVTTSAALVATDLPSFRFHVPTEMVQITVAHGALFALMDGSSVEDSSTLVLRNQLWQGISWGDLQNAFGARLEPPTDFPMLISVIECQSANSVETHFWWIDMHVQIWLRLFTCVHAAYELTMCSCLCLLLIDPTAQRGSYQTFTPSAFRKAYLL